MPSFQTLALPLGGFQVQTTAVHSNYRVVPKKEKKRLLCLTDQLPPFEDGGVMIIDPHWYICEEWLSSHSAFPAHLVNAPLIFPEGFQASQTSRAFVVFASYGLVAVPRRLTRQTKCEIFQRSMGPGAKTYHLTRASGGTPFMNLDDSVNSYGIL